MATTSEINLISNQISSYVSSFSAILSLVFMIITIHQTKKYFVKNANLYYFEKIFDEYLIEKIPADYEKLLFDKDLKLVEYKNIANDLNELRKKAKFFEFFDENFYLSIKAHTQKIEDYILNTANSPCEKSKQSQIYVNIKKMIKQMYDVINKKRLI